MQLNCPLRFTSSMHSYTHALWLLCRQASAQYVLCNAKRLNLRSLCTGSVGLELAAGKDGKAVGGEVGHYTVRNRSMHM